MDWGLSNAAIEPWGEFGYGWTAEKTSLSMRTPYYSPLIAYAIPWSGSTHGPVSGRTFLVEQMDSGWVADHLAQMRGKILLLPAAGYHRRPPLSRRCGTLYATAPWPRWAIRICLAGNRSRRIIPYVQAYDDRSEDDPGQRRAGRAEQ